MEVVVNSVIERNESGKGAINGHSSDWQYKQISERLEQIRQYLESEVRNKQQTIDQQREEIDKLKKDIQGRTAVIDNLQQQLQDCKQHTEGHRQLINKLLSDIEHYQNDIEWYKRTYERRSLWGVLKEKLTKKS